MSAKHMENLQYGYPYEFLIRSGRAVMIPAYWGTLERGPSLWNLPDLEERERSLKWSWDLSRSVDYLQTRRGHRCDEAWFLRPQLGSGACRRECLLWILASKRQHSYPSGLLRSQPPEVDSWNFAPRYHVPTLMVNGKQDFIIPYETNRKYCSMLWEHQPQTKNCSCLKADTETL